jgi:alkylation response protein AidB-like acyl-CoA dehydrogenase
MDFTLPPEAEAFRAELQAWLDANLDDRYRRASQPIDAPPDRLEILREWNRRLADAGWAAIAWPEEYGGRGAGLIEQVVWAEEMHRAGAPPTLNPIGLSNIAPAIMLHGREDQKRRFLPAMRRGDDIWCQGFSEPDAGSDLAGLRTQAVRDGDHYLVNGQKVWNTLGDVADWCQLLVRTDPGVPKHKGISCLIVDLSLPGIEIRPIPTITGETEFCEIFFRDVCVPVSALLGEENAGWGVAMTTLSAERAGVATLYLRLSSRIEALIERARAIEVNGQPATRDPRHREKLARVVMEGDLLRRLSERALSGMVHGRLGAEGSLTKLVWSRAEQHLGEVAGEVLGLEALGGSWGRERLASRSLSIAGGTTEVNKNIVAQRVLGLPRST